MLNTGPNPADLRFAPDGRDRIGASPELGICVALSVSFCASEYASAHEVRCIGAEHAAVMCIP